MPLNPKTNPKPNPNPNRGEIFLGGNDPDTIYFTFTVIFYSNYEPLNREGILKKLLRTISQESANVLMNETRIILLQQNRAEKDWGIRRRKKISSGTAVDEEISQ